MHEVITDNLDLWTSALLTKSTAGRGSNGRLEAYGIKKLRELILELAVRGKLVPQDPNDEPASELLKKTVFEKKRLVNANIIREGKAPVYPNEPPDHHLPNGWVWTNLYEIGEIAPRNDAGDAEEASFVQMTSISEKYGTPVQHEVMPWGEIKSGFTHFREEDVVLAKITPCFQNGKSAVMRSLTNGFGAGTTELHVYRTINACTVSEYVLIYLKSPRFIGDGVPKMTGTAGQKRITRDYFAGNHFPLPPLAEQHRIVAKVDELMALCDQLEQQQTNNIEAHQTLVETLLGTLTSVESPQELTEAWNRIADHFDTLFTAEQSIDQLKQTILQLAVIGKLVPQDPDDEPASVLLEKIKNEKERFVKEGKVKKDSSVTPLGDEYKPPSNWESIVVQDFADVRLGSTPSRTEPKYWDGDIPWVSSGEVANCIINDTSEKISKDGFDKSSVSLIPKRSVLIAIIGQGKTRGQSAILNIDACTNQNVAALVFNEELVVPEFVWLWAKSKYEAHRGGGRGGAQPALNGKMVRGFRFYLPPTGEQHRIVAKVDELMALCDSLKARLTDAQTTQVHLADAIVEQAVA